MEVTTQYLWSKGGLTDATVPCLRPRTVDEVFAAFERVRLAGKHAVLVGQRKSFGEQFLPPDGHYGLDLSDLCVGARIVEECADGDVWVRVGGGTTFAQLHARYPGYAPHSPPTSDGISVAGALAACTHNAVGYFADAVRAFTLLAPNGQRYSCRAEAEGLAGQLFRAVPGSFGLLGVVADMELCLTRVRLGQEYVVNALYAGVPEGDGYLREFARVVDTPRYASGNGLLLFRNRRGYIVFGDEVLGPGQFRDGRQALLTDDGLTQQALSQGIVNRIPRLAEVAMKRVYPKGAGLSAPWYGFLFFQRSYDVAHEVLSRPGLGYGLLRALGVDPKLTVCHQTWFFPREEAATFMEIYWSTMDEFPGIERRIEQQDMVLLPPSNWPSHSMGRTAYRLGALTATLSVRKQGGTFERAAAFFREVSRRAYRANPEFRVSLCKQLHCEPDVLRATHASYVREIAALRALVDPAGLLTSRFWKALT